MQPPPLSMPGRKECIFHKRDDYLLLTTEDEPMPNMPLPNMPFPPLHIPLPNGMPFPPPFPPTGQAGLPL